jgi:serine/threonine-protein kinase RsbW
MDELPPVRQLPRNRQRPAPFVELQNSLPSRITAISPYIDQLMRFINGFIKKLGAVEESEMDIEMALREALANAVIHGNHEDPHKRIHVTCRCQKDGEVSITVRDKGDGFDGPPVPDPTDPHMRLLPNGRGIHIMRALMDEVSFEEHGNVVHMRKKLRTAFK